MQNKIQNRLKRELKQVTTAQIKGKTFKTAVIVEDENKILIFFDDGSFLVENRICKVDPRSPMGYSKGCPFSRSAMTESMDPRSISDGYHTFAATPACAISPFH